MELVPEFWQALSREAALTLHIRALSVDNSHHLAEAAFKATGRALRAALKPGSGIASTKGYWLDKGGKLRSGKHGKRA